jgi:hypothetical protein
MFLSTTQAFSLQNQYMGNDEMAETEQSVMDDTAASVSLAGWVTSVGFFHYLCLYQGYGTVMLGNGEEFAWITYIEFVITTPSTSLWVFFLLGTCIDLMYFFVIC